VPTPAAATAAGCGSGSSSWPRLAQETGRAITVCHLPPGTSKWNRIEHRLFSAISMNRRGRYLLGVKVRAKELAAEAPQTAG
jgi:Rhodopirellula transposase DDE domain